MRGRVNNLGHAVMIEVNGHESRADKNSHALPDYRGLWVVDLEAAASIELDRERLERFAMDHRKQHFPEILRGHRSVPFSFHRQLRFAISFLLLDFSALATTVFKGLMAHA